MASAVLNSRNELYCYQGNVNARTTGNFTGHPQLNSRFYPNPNPNPSFYPNLVQVENVSAISHFQQSNVVLLPGSALNNTSVSVNRENNAVVDQNDSFHRENAVVDRNDSFHRECVTFNLASYSKSGLKDLKKRFVNDLDRVRALLMRIEATEQLRLETLHSNASQEVELVGGKSGKNGKKRSVALAVSGKDSKRKAVVEGDKFTLTMKRRCQQILTKIMNQKYGYVFNKPVDVKGLKLYDYYDIIKHPMDLGTVKLKLVRNKYRALQDFAADVRLTFRNAMTYNPKGQDVHTYAQEYLDKFEEMFKPDIEKYYGVKNQKVPTVMQQQQRKLSQPELILPPNPLPEPVPMIAKNPNVVHSHSTLLNQHQYQVQSSSTPVFVPPDVKSPPQLAPCFVSPSVKSPPRPVSTPRSAKLPKPKAKDPNKRLMTFEEKGKLVDNLQNLPAEKLDHIVHLLKRKYPNLAQEGDEIELDLEVFDNETLWELDRVVGYHKKFMSKMKKQGDTEDGVAAAQLYQSSEKAPTPEHAMLKNKKGDVMEEDVDIGEEIPIGNFPPVQIEKDVPCGSSSSSSSSSSSDSSSGGSSSSSDSDEDSVQSPLVEANAAPTT